MFNITRSL